MKKDTKRMIAAVMAAGMMAMSLAACGDTGDSGESSSAAASTTAATSAAAEGGAEGSGETAEVTPDQPAVTALTENMETEAPEVGGNEGEEQPLLDPDSAKTVDFTTTVTVGFHDCETGLDLDVSASGSYEYTPSVDGEPIADTADFEQNLSKEISGALADALSDLSAQEVPYSALPEHYSDISAAILESLTGGGRPVSAVTVTGIELTGDSAALYADAAAN